MAGVVAVRLQWSVNRYRALAEQLNADLEESQRALEMSEAKRISAEAVAAERKEEAERLHQMLANAEAARDRAVQSMNEVNSKLLQAVTPEREPLWKRQQPAGPDGAQMIPLPQKRRSRPADQADELYFATLKLQAEQARKKAEALRNLPKPGTLPLSN